jgi:hypothetical protein
MWRKTRVTVATPASEYPDTGAGPVVTSLPATRVRPTAHQESGEFFPDVLTGRAGWLGSIAILALFLCTGCCSQSHHIGSGG